MSERLEVPDEMKDLMDEWIVCCKCRDQAISSMFRAKRAIYYGKQAEKATREFWKQVAKLYPHTAGKKLSYKFDDQVVVIN
jgi:hypothetical protein